MDAVRHGRGVLINFAHHAGKQEKSEVMAAELCNNKPLVGVLS